MPHWQPLLFDIVDFLKAITVNQQWRAQDFIWDISKKMSLCRYSIRLYSRSNYRWLYCVECPQYSIRLEALGYLYDYLSGRGLLTLSGHAHLDRQRYVACRRPVSDVAENLGRFLVWSIQFRGMALN